uniref:Uncharacterized protein n=1 Tax=Grammatophora oceanica TaxID=210454 RepID=A0A7S1URQ9_9STRA|mmetsp:Transcript_19035/g.28165  ORF Transcript_19035/g.28165 Transcript_19035/m.28165 type:complete len:430 (+) Transcript_19035:53-1342(+)
MNIDISSCESISQCLSAIKLNPATTTSTKEDVMQGDERVTVESDAVVEVFMQQDADMMTATASRAPSTPSEVTKGKDRILRTASKGDDTSATEELSSESSKNMQQQDSANRRAGYGTRQHGGSSRSLEQNSNTVGLNQMRKVHSMGDLRGGSLVSPSKASRQTRKMSSATFTAPQKNRTNFYKGILTVSQPHESAQYPSMEFKWQEARRKRRQSKIKDGVSFGHVEIREHPIVPGDNPGGFHGPPLSIDWVHQTSEVMKIDDYEKERPPRRMGSQMNIPSTVRHEMLLNNGYTSSEIQRAMKHVNIARNRRKRTIETLQLRPLHEALEKMSRGTNNFLFGRGRKQKERQYIHDAMIVHGTSLAEEEYQERAKKPADKTREESSPEKPDLKLTTREKHAVMEINHSESHDKEAGDDSNDAASSSDEEEEA